MNDIDRMVKNGLQAAAQQPVRPQAVPTVIAVTDLQIIGRMAAQLYDDDISLPPEFGTTWSRAVETAILLYAETVVQLNAGALPRAIEAAKMRASNG